MANLNKVMLIGNLTKDPELRYTPSGTPVVNITLAINRKFKSGDTMKDEVAFISVVIWAKIAEVVCQYCYKGGQLFVEGRIQTRTWDKDGQKQYKTEVVAESIQLMSSKKESRKEEEPDWLPDEESANA